MCMGNLVSSGCTGDMAGKGSGVRDWGIIVFGSVYVCVKVSGFFKLVISTAGQTSTLTTDSLH